MSVLFVFVFFNGDEETRGEKKITRKNHERQNALEKKKKKIYVSDLMKKNLFFLLKNKRKIE